MEIYKEFHKNILSTINNNNYLNDLYFRIFHTYIIHNIFDNNYFIMLSSSKFLDILLNSNIDSDKYNLIQNIYKYNVKNEIENKCFNCNNIISLCDTFCKICGAELNNIIYIEESYKKTYSFVFNQKIKKHNPNKHCEIWLLQLQGKENITISSENFKRLINIAEKWINQNNQLELSCVIIRKWLKCLSLTHYNSHITWIRIQIESVCNIKGYSYDLTNEEIIKILEYFNEIILQFPIIISNNKILQHLKKKKIHNMIYYPYCIVRILHFVINNKKRLNILLSNVHFQNKITLSKNEFIWKEICNILNYNYIPLEL